MTTVDPYAALNGSQAQTAAQKKSVGQLGINDFLTLMTTQLKNQDPLKPMDSTAFVAQLAQFGTVSGIQAMQTSIGTLADSLRSSQALSGASLVGHSILAPATTATIDTGGLVGGAVDTPTGTSSLQVTINDASGQAIRHIAVPPSTGLTGFTWDGLTDAGTPATAGAYSFSAVANVGGTNQSLQTLLAGQVASVTIDPTNQVLTLNTSGLGPIPLTTVRSVM